MTPRFFLPVLASLALAITAQADTLSYFRGMPETAVSTTPTVTELQLPAFDASLGTLTGVKLSFTTELWQTAQAENLAHSAANFGFTGTTTVGLVRIDGAVLQTPQTLQMTLSAPLGAFDGVMDFSGQSGLTLTQYGSFSGQYRDLNLASYVGTGTIAFGATGQALTQLSASSGSLLAGYAARYATGLTVEYSFQAGGGTAVPESPFFATLIGLTALGVTLGVRRRPVGRS